MKSIAFASIAVAVTIALGGTTAAQPAAPPPAEEPPYQSTALLMSFGGSLGAWTTLLIGASLDHGDNPAVPLGFVATLLAPSFGQWYAGNSFSRGLRTRLIGAGVMVAAAIPALSCEDECSPSRLLEVAFYSGLGLYIFGTLDDIITAPDAARAAQLRHNIGLAPMIHRGGSGLVVTAQF